MILNERDSIIVRKFCMGYEPSYIDRNLSLRLGTSRNVISGWWLDDKENRNGGIERVLGFGWRDKVRTFKK